MSTIEKKDEMNYRESGAFIASLCNAAARRPPGEGRLFFENWNSDEDVTLTHGVLRAAPYILRLKVVL